MLPASDELNHVISRHYDRPLATVKRIADALYVGIALLINLFTWIFAPEQMVLSIGISSVASVFLTGTFVGLTFRFFPSVRMQPVALEV